MDSWSSACACSDHYHSIENHFILQDVNDFGHSGIIATKPWMERVLQFRVCPKKNHPLNR